MECLHRLPKEGRNALGEIAERHLGKHCVYRPVILCISRRFEDIVQTGKAAQRQHRFQGVTHGIDYLCNPGYAGIPLPFVERLINIGADKQGKIRRGGPIDGVAVVLPQEGELNGIVLDSSSLFVVICSAAPQLDTEYSACKGVPEKHHACSRQAGGHLVNCGRRRHLPAAYLCRQVPNTFPESGRRILDSTHYDVCGRSPERHDSFPKQVHGLQYRVISFVPEIHNGVRESVLVVEGGFHGLLDGVASGLLQNRIGNLPAAQIIGSVSPGLQEAGERGFVIRIFENHVSEAGRPFHGLPNSLKGVAVENPHILANNIRGDIIPQLCGVFQGVLYLFAFPVRPCPAQQIPVRLREEIQNRLRTLILRDRTLHGRSHGVLCRLIRYKPQVSKHVPNLGFQISKHGHIAPGVPLRPEGHRHFCRLGQQDRVLSRVQFLLFRFHLSRCFCLLRLPCGLQIVLLKLRINARLIALLNMTVFNHVFHTALNGLLHRHELPLRGHFLEH